MFQRESDEDLFDSANHTVLLINKRKREEQEVPNQPEKKTKPLETPHQDKIILNTFDFKRWTKEEVCSLLCTDEVNGGAGLRKSLVAPLYLKGFSGNSLNMIAQDIMKEKDALKLALELNPNINPYTVKSIVEWVENLLESRLYHLWTIDYIKKQLAKSIIHGGAGLNEE